MCVFGGEDFVIAVPIFAGGGADPVGNAVAGGVLAGHDAGAGGRADLAGGVAIGEAHSLSGDAVDVGRFVKSRSLDGEVMQAEVVGEDEDDVGLFIVGVCDGQAG